MPAVWVYIHTSGICIGRFLKKENSPLQTDDKFIDTTAVDWVTDY